MKIPIFNKLKVVASCLTLLLLSSCSKHEEPRVSSTPQQGGTYLSLETSLGDESTASARAVSWQMGAMGHYPIVSLNRTQPNRNHPAIIVIRNKPNSGTAKTYYLDANFYRDTDSSLRLGDNNTSEIRLDKDIYGQHIKLNYNEEWYLMAFFKGTWDQDQKRMSYNNINGNWWKTMQVNNTTGAVDQPLTLPWTRMELVPSNGKAIFRPMGTPSAIKAMGTIISIRLRNRAPSLRSVRRLALNSNVLSSGGGYYSLEESNLPEIPSLGADPIAPIWHPTEAIKPNNFYNSGYREVKNGSNRHTPNLVNNEMDSYYPYIWGMPITNTSGVADLTEIHAEIGWDNVGTTGRTRHEVAYETVVWNSNSSPKHNSSIGVLANITDTEIPGTRKKTRPAGHP